MHIFKLENIFLVYAHKSISCLFLFSYNYLIFHYQQFQFLSQDYHQVKSIGTKPRLSINVTKDRVIMISDYNHI